MCILDFGDREQALSTVQVLFRARLDQVVDFIGLLVSESRLHVN